MQETTVINNDLLYQLNISFPGPVSERFENFLSENAPWGWEEQSFEQQTIFILHCDKIKQAEMLKQTFCSAFPTIKAEILKTPKLDWGSAWQDFFKPIQVGRFTVLPEWLRHEADKTCQIPLIIAPKMAFGTGHHNTTSLCLQALDELAQENSILKGDKFLDLGTGSGILGIAAARLGLKGIGLDIDPVAVDNALENCQINTLQDSFLPLQGSLQSLEPDNRFELIIANILSRPLMDMAGQLTNLMFIDSSLILSGILKEQAPEVISVYQSHGLTAPRVLYDQEWVALVWKQIRL